MVVESFICTYCPLPTTNPIYTRDTASNTYYYMRPIMTATVTSFLSPPNQIMVFASLESPLILSSDFFLFFRGEIILDIEGLPNLFWSLALNHISHCLAGQIKQTFNVQIVRCLKKITRYNQRKSDSNNQRKRG